jgi:nickel-dependent lactate racemase
MFTHVPYGNSQLEINLSDLHGCVDVLLPKKFDYKSDFSPGELVENALSSPLGERDPFNRVNKNTTVAITVNDKTRPVPNSVLIAPLINRLIDRGVSKENITLFIASGTHLPMQPDEFSKILSDEIVKNFKIVAHDCDDNANLYEIGLTNRNTHVFVNRDFYDHDLKIVVGDIELHHFAGYSGGVKSAAIGLTGRQTINANHRLLLDPRSTIAIYKENPLRQDIEEIGRLIGVDYALNAVLDENREILQVLFGESIQVMHAGVDLVNRLSQVEIEAPYDLVIASAGGYPKDINLYQAQKAMTHAAKFCKQKGQILLFAECREGAGSQSYLDFMAGMSDPRQVIEKFTRTGFSVGPHKAYQIARIIEKHQVYIRSSMDDLLVRSLLLTPIPAEIPDLAQYIHRILPQVGRIAILPYATACIPKLLGANYDER